MGTTSWQIRKYVPDSDDDSDDEDLAVTEDGQYALNEDASDKSPLSSTTKRGWHPLERDEQILNEQDGQDIKRERQYLDSSQHTDSAVQKTHIISEDGIADNEASNSRNYDDLEDQTAVHNVSSPRENATIFSDSLSPLSSMSNTPISLSPRPSQQQDKEQSQMLSHNINFAEASEFLSRQEHRPARQLRERKAIQLNPYAVEGQMYKQAWRSRGLVPLQVKNNSQVEINEPAQLSSSQLEYESQSSDDARSVLNSRLEDSDAQEGTNTLPIEESFSASQSAPGTPPESAEGKASKRRKLAHTHSRKHQHQAKTPTSGAFHVREDGWIEVPFAFGKMPSPTKKSHQKAANKRSLLKTTSDSFPSAMTPVSVRSSIPFSSPTLPDVVDPRTKSITITKGVPLQQLQTPTTSSDVPSYRTKRLYQRQTSIHSLPKQVSEDENSSIMSNGSTSGDEDDNNQILRQITKAQKRTKGVLPASWHRLEYQKLMKEKPQAVPKQQTLFRSHRFSITSPSREARKGIAKRITGTQRRTHGNGSGSISQAIIDIESDSEEDNIVTMQAKQQQEIGDFFPTDEHEHFASFDDDDDDDDDTNMEDNSIDPMTGHGSTDKSRNIYRRNTKQPKIKDYIPPKNTRQEKQNSFANSYDTTNRQPWRKASTNNKKQKRVRNILDVATRLTREQTPNFLAYAARTARQRKHPGQHSITQKHRHSSYVKENRKRQQRLQVGKGNLTSQAKNPHDILREPLHERSSNNSRIPIVPYEDEEVNADSGGEAGFQQPQSLAAETRENLHPRDEGGANYPTNSIQKNKFFVQGFPITSATGLVHPIAQAHLETIDRNRQHRYAVQRGRRLVLDRFLQRSAPQARSSSSVPLTPTPIPETTHKARKRPPRQVPIAIATENDQNGSCESNSEERSSKELQAAVLSNSSRLQGLLPFGVEYPTAFSVSRLPNGCHFHTDTLVGSGIFSESLNMSLEHVHLNSFRSTIDGEIVEWGGWNEKVAQQIFDICNRAVDSMTYLGQVEPPTVVLPNELVEQLRSVIKYLSGYLKFLDPVDCKDFVIRWTALMDRYDDQFRKILFDAVPKDQFQTFTTDIACYTAIIANQIRQIADQSQTDKQIKKSISEASTRILQHLIQLTVRNSFKDLQLFAKDAVNLSDHVSRSKISQKIEALVVISHLHQNSNASVQTMWDVLRESDTLVLPKRLTVSTLERVWKTLFSLLPILELDSKGQAPKHVLAFSRTNNWKLVKQLIEPVFAAYPNAIQKSTIHQYCRALYVRCYSLLDYWGWNDCESIMGFLFDFFAQNQLHDLRLEFNPRFNSFLDNLTSTTNLDIRVSDCCFHVLLKLIGRGLKLMRTQYKDKRISNCIWRLTPNHDRSLPKDESLRQEDLNAVHNHLDLLVVLYWAAPPQHRIRVDLVQKLIDVENSHKEVCHLVIKTWSNLVSFQLSTQESADKLDTFVQWYEEIIVKLTKLHRLARTEVESDARRAEVLGGRHFTKDDQEQIIQASQHNVQSLLMDALSSLKDAILKTETVENLRKMLPSSFRFVLELWEAPQSNTNRIATQVLNVIQAWILRAQRLRNAEDSQGYGDWSGIEELIPEIAQTSLTVPNDLQQALHDLISGIFGSETTVEDDLLQNSIHCWLDVAELDVTAGYLMWDDLIDPYAPRSWMILRDTAQTRKFTPLFLALLIRRDPDTYKRKKSMIIQCWIECLVERESLIKYQPDLTSALFDQEIAEPLFQNQPFSKKHDTFEISLADFLDQRTSLIACVLSNMRESLSFSMYHQLSDYQVKRKDYSDLLRHLMNTMKNNFQSLGQGSDLQGAYVAFTQKIVQLLQEHTADICKVDGFFLDAVNFPLPVDDPEYLVSKLKCLALQLHSNRGAQQLSAFIQSICERAVIEGKQSHFASLIFSATEGVFEASRGEHLTLRFYICCEILPNYIDIVSSTPCGWIVAETVLLSVPMMLRSLLQSLDAFDTVSMTAVRSIISEVLDSVSRLLSGFFRPHLDLDVRTTIIVTRCLAIVESALNTGDYVAQCSANVFDRYTDSMVFFTNLALHVIAKLGHLEFGADCPTAITNASYLDDPRPVRLEAARRFVRESLHDSLDSTSRKCKWQIRDDMLFVHRNVRWDMVEFDLRSQEQRQQKLLASARSLLEKLQATPSFCWIVTEAMTQYPGITDTISTTKAVDRSLDTERAHFY